MYQDILKDTEIYQIIVQEGVEKGLSQGREEGIEQQQQQEIKYLQQMILAVMHSRFPELEAQAEKRIAEIADLGVLRQAASGIVTANTAEQARTLLETLQKSQDH